MAIDFSRYTKVAVESIEAPVPIPTGHYFATIKSWKGQERDYNKATGGDKTPVAELTFSLTSPDSDVEEDLLPPKGISGRVAMKDYDFTDGGPWQLRKLGEVTCKLDIKGLELEDVLDALKGQEVRVFVSTTPGKDDGQFFSKVTKVFPASED